MPASAACCHPLPPPDNNGSVCQLCTTGGPEMPAVTNSAASRLAVPAWPAVHAVRYCSPRSPCCGGRARRRCACCTLCWQLLRRTAPLPLSSLAPAAVVGASAAKAAQRRARPGQLLGDAFVPAGCQGWAQRGDWSCGAWQMYHMQCTCNVLCQPHTSWRTNQTLSSPHPAGAC